MAGLSAKTPVHKTSKRGLVNAAKKAKKVKKVQKKVTKKKSATLPQSRAFSAPSIHLPPRTGKYALSNKESTLVAGLDVVPNGREVLESLYLHTIDLAKQYNQKTNQFLYKSIENFTTYRLAVLRKYPHDVSKVERIIGQGQIEELIEQAEEELMLMDTLNNTKERPVNEDIMKAHAPPFARGNPKCETQIFPLPDEVAFELATGKFTVLPYHPTKPMSRKFMQHIGHGDEITPEQHAQYDEMLTMTEDEKAEVVKKAKQTDLIDFMRKDYEDCLLINKDKPLEDGYFEWFDTNHVAYPEENIPEIARLTALHEPCRKL